MRIPVILQADRAECGVACLAMVAAYYGYRATLREYRLRFRPSVRGMTLGRLQRCADEIGLKGRAIRAELDELPQLRTPAILHWQLDHFVVLKATTPRGALIIDPAVGARRVSTDDLSAQFTGVALELAPSPSFSPRQQPEQVKLASFIPALRGLGRHLVTVFVMTLALQLFALVMPLNTQFTVDQGIRQGDMSVVIALALGFGLVALISAVTNYLRALLVQFVGNTAAFRMVSGLAHHMLRLSDTK